MPEALSKEYPYLNNTTADIRLLGMPAILNPGAQFTSAARSNMLASHIPQALIIKSCEFPQLFTGVEYELGRQEYSTSRREQDAEILAVIPKYVTTPSYNGAHIKTNPHLLVIYRGMEDNKIHYILVERHTKGIDGFGYENTWLNTHMLYGGTHGAANAYLPKDVVLSTSPAHKGNGYCLGTNLNTAYVTMVDTIEDAMLISESAAKKFETLSIATVLINIRQDCHPVNLYGDENGVKAFPDIGDVVGSHGFLCAFRQMQTDTYAADLDVHALITPNQETDDITRLEAGSLILDMEYVCNPQRRNFGAFGYQMEKYNNALKTYYDKILDIYNLYKGRYGLSEEFNTLVTTAITRSLILNPGKKIPDLKIPGKKMAFEVEGFIRKQTVDYVQVMITYAAPRELNKAFKISDRCGTKGVVPRICPDDEMPVDAYGIKADIVIDPTSPVARMNFGQLHEVEINRISMFVQRLCADLYKTNPQAAAELLVEWYSDVNPNYGALCRQTYPGETLIQHVKKAIDTCIHIHVPPFLNTITPENIAFWSEKWGAHATPVTYSLHDRNGNKRTYTTKYPISIGSKYVYCLAKIPSIASAGVSFVSHYGLPIKPDRGSKHRSAVRMVPIRFGEDEYRLLAMDVEEQEVARMSNLYSNSPKGLEVMVNTILESDHPTALSRIPISNQDLARSSSVTAMFHHTTSILGIETRTTLTTETPPPGLRNDSLILGANESRLGSGFSDGWDGAERDGEKWLSKTLEDADDIADSLLDPLPDGLLEEELSLDILAEPDVALAELTGQPIETAGLLDDVVQELTAEADDPDGPPADPDLD